MTHYLTSYLSSWSYGIEYFCLIGQALSKAQRREHSVLCDQSCNDAQGLNNESEMFDFI